MLNLPIYVGYDPKESIAWHTMVQSIMENSSCPLAIHPVNIRNYTKIFSRKPDTSQSNEFSFSRFLVPYLQNYEGIAVFMDCDMMLRGDVAELFSTAVSEPEKAVHVVKHDYTPKNRVKYLGQSQHSYPRKNWSSVVVWNCSHPSNKHVDLDFVNNGTGAELHRFSWLCDDEIGELDVGWNWLVGEYSPESSKNDVKNVHWTVGGPYFNEYSEVEFADEWQELKSRTIRCDQVE